MSWKRDRDDTYGKKKTKFVTNPEDDKRFDELRRKYANAIAFLLVQQIP